MKEWFSTKELAGKSGMPKTVQGVKRKSIRENWHSRKRSGRGGGKEYHISSLPESTRIELARVEASTTVTESTKAGNTAAKELKKKAQTKNQARQTGSKDFSSLNETGKKRVDAKLAILNAYKTFLKASRLNVCHAMEMFVTQYNQGEIEMESWIREAKGKISVASLRAWNKKVQTKGITALGGNYKAWQGSSKIDRQPDLKQFVIAMLTEYPHASTSILLQAIRARFGKTDHDLPSSRSLGRYITKWKQENAEIFTAIINPDKWKNEYMLAFGSASERVARLNQLWEFDSTKADVMLTDGRYSILGVIDVFSRRGKLLVSKTSKATAVASLTRRSILNWGVPEEALTDNGKDYTSKHMKRVFGSLDIVQTLCPPFCSWKKPHIERFFETFSHSIVELLPGYIGHNVADRKDIEARKSFAQRLMTKGELVDVQLNSLKLQEICDRWVENCYHHERHNALGKSPFEMVAEWTEPIRMIKEEQVLDVLLAEVPGQDGWRTVNKKGIKVDSFQFIHPELGYYSGERVKVFYDEYDSQDQQMEGS